MSLSKNKKLPTLNLHHLVGLDDRKLGDINLSLRHSPFFLLGSWSVTKARGVSFVSGFMGQERRMCLYSIVLLC